MIVVADLRDSSTTIGSLELGFARFRVAQQAQAK
jgi:hypothetical protein